MRGSIAPVNAARKPEDVISQQPTMLAERRARANFSRDYINIKHTYFIGVLITGFSPHA